MCEKQTNNAYCLRDRIRAIDRDLEIERLAHNKRKDALNDERDKLVAELHAEGFSVSVTVPSLHMGGTSVTMNVMTPDADSFRP